MEGFVKTAKTYKLQFTQEEFLNHLNLIIIATPRNTDESKLKRELVKLCESLLNE